MIKRYYYWGNLLLMGGLCLSACGNKNPGVSKEELRREFAKSATPATDVEDSLAGWGDNDSLQVFPEDYQAPSGIKYDSHITDHGMIVLNVESALRNVRPMKLTDLGHQKIITGSNQGCPIIIGFHDPVLHLLPDETD